MDGLRSRPRGACRPHPLGRWRTDASAHSPLENRPTDAGFPQPPTGRDSREKLAGCHTRTRPEAPAQVPAKSQQSSGTCGSYGRLRCRPRGSAVHSSHRPADHGQGAPYHGLRTSGLDNRHELWQTSTGRRAQTQLKTDTANKVGRQRRSAPTTVRLRSDSLAAFVGIRMHPAGVCCPAACATVRGHGCSSPLSYQSSGTSLGPPLQRSITAS